MKRKPLYWQIRSGRKLYVFAQKPKVEAVYPKKVKMVIHTDEAPDLWPSKFEEWLEGAAPRYKCGVQRVRQ